MEGGRARPWRIVLSDGTTVPVSTDAIETEHGWFGWARATWQGSPVVQTTYRYYADSDVAAIARAVQRLAGELMLEGYADVGQPRRAAGNEQHESSQEWLCP